MIPLTKLQKEITAEFYNYPKEKVIFDKAERNNLWKIAKAKSGIDIEDIRRKCPALAHQIEKSFANRRNIQSAVFSECVYAQTLANMLRLNVFANCLENNSFVPQNVSELLKSYHLFSRYAYSNSDKSRMLIQAGGCNGIDSALITVIDLNIYAIEFKEPGAKTSEADLPKYKEDGNLLATKDFLEKYPQFQQMIEEQKGLNFFKEMGSNINNFSAESVNVAVTDNYAKKYADVVCTEDAGGYLVMLPANQLSLWAKIVGEIRPAGRNRYKVWTPQALKNCIAKEGGKIVGTAVSIKKSNLGVRKERGGDGRVSGYKINSLFFVRIKDCIENGGVVSFDMRNVRQLNPTIAGKIFFKNLNYDSVKKHYFGN